MGCLALWISAFAERACATVVSGRYSAWRVPTLWIPAYAGMTVRCCLVFTLTFDSSPIKGEGLFGCIGLVHPHTALPLWIADQVRNDGASWPVGAQRGVSHPCPVDTGSSPV